MSAEWAVGPNYKQRASQLTHIIDARTGAQHDAALLETKVLLFEDRAKGWFFDIARGLCDGGHGGYAVLQIATSQVEGLQQYIEGRSSRSASSREAFVRGMVTVFQDAKGYEPELGQFYDRVRCGLFHDGFTKSNVVISWRFRYPLVFTAQVIQINPQLFLASVEAAVERYVSELRDPSKTDLRKRFEARWTQASSP